jgi:hypothetical protein
MIKPPPESAGVQPANAATEIVRFNPFTTLFTEKAAPGVKNERVSMD